MTGHLVVVGGGFSGSLHAINLLRHDGPRVTLVERNAEPARGLAYGAAHPAHLLNVRASQMSALPDEPDHFLHWLRARGLPGGADDFVPRLTYGDYLQALLAESRSRSPGRLEIRRGEGADLALSRDGVTLMLADGSRIHADTATLAIGNLPPHTPPGLDPDRLGPGLYWPDPWDSRFAEGLQGDEPVLLIGTGLTMVDVALMLEMRGHNGPILALSRRGLLPRSHAVAVPFGGRSSRPSTRASALVSDVRRRAREAGWRVAVDELRPMTQIMWRAATDDQRSRFLRHLRPWWDVHRHRLAPEVHARLNALHAASRLRVVAGRLVGVEDSGGSVRVSWRPRGRATVEESLVARVVNCTGPQGDLLATTEPLLRRLLDRGVIRPDAHRIGVDVDKQARTIRADGAPNPRLLAVGPLTRGAFWEINAVPDIRAQVWDIARRLSNAHWVGGEGL